MHSVYYKVPARRLLVIDTLYRPMGFSAPTLQALTGSVPSLSNLRQLLEPRNLLLHALFETRVGMDQTVPLGRLLSSGALAGHKEIVACCAVNSYLASGCVRAMIRDGAKTQWRQAQQVDAGCIGPALKTETITDAPHCVEGAT
ncbi:MAG: hypothetical protein ABI612_19420 [Betaproteobacteria bacterium]